MNILFHGICESDPLPPYVSPQCEQRWYRRHRRRKPPFFRRRKDAMTKVKMKTSHSNPKSTDWDCDLFASIPFGKRLTYMSNLVGEQFDGLCEQNSDLIMLFGNEDKFNIFNTNQHRQSMLTEFFFSLGSDVLVDLTEITDTNSLFRFQASYEMDDTGPKLIFDSGASVSISPVREDFVNFDSNVGNMKLTGVTAEAVCKGKGIARFRIRTDSGKDKLIESEALYVPQANVRLLSVQRYCMQKKQGSQFLVNENGCEFTLPRSLGGDTITFDLESNSMLPQTSVMKQWGRKMTRKPNSALTIVSSDNLNLDPAQKTLLEWHWKLGHYNMNWIRYLIRQGIILVRNKHASNAHCLCSACQLAKQTRKNEGAVHEKLRPNKDGALKKGLLAVGGRVSTDQFVSSVPGRLPHTFGKEKKHEQFTGGTVFIDEASAFFFVQNQVSLGAAETLRAKTRFEREALRHGIMVRGYRGDNGVYKSQAFRASCKTMNQTLEFSGVGAHHHNGISERGIRTVSTCARTMMLHAMLHWPEETTLDLWPFAVDYSVYIWNRMPRQDSGLSPLEVFYSTKSTHEELRNCKVWGCPVYVLDPTLQDGKKLPRWQPRSKVGQFLGRSKEHASSVGLIKNVKTGKVSSQFHVVYDDHFTTLAVNKKPEDVDLPKEWIDLFIHNREKHFDDADLDKAIVQPTLKPLNTPTVPSNNTLPVDPSLPSTSRGDSETSQKTVTFDDAVPPVGSQPSEAPAASIPLPETATTSGRRSRRLQQLPPENVGLVSCLHTDDYLTFLHDFNSISHHDAFLVSSDLNHHTDSLTSQYDLLHLMKQCDFDEEIQNGTHPMAFAAKANAEDTPNLKEAMSGPDAEGFVEAMKKEIEELEGMEAWDVVPREMAIKTGRKILASTWAFKRKRYPDGSVKKLKARLVARGDQQIEGVDYFDSFSPVVQWSTIRLLLIMSIMLNLKTIQVDYTLAFVQAPAENNTFVEMPRMFEVPGYVFQLKRNLYGLCEAPRNFFSHLKKGLNDRGLVNSTNDHCLFYNENIMVICYVDDCIFLAKDEQIIDDLINDLREPANTDNDKFLLNKEEDYAGFLGIDIRPSTHEDGAIELLQTGLIDRILKVLSLDGDNVKIRNDPASTTPLGKLEDSAPRKDHWSYASVIGMFLYLASNSRPDIAFAVHQCARFTHCANSEHEIAVKRIARYLKATRDFGLIIKPNKDLRLEMYADADFAGLWNVENRDDPISVRSRTGYVILLGDVPVTWSSKLQTEIATSTMHAEYIALSTGMRELLPVKRLLEEICNILEIERNDETKVTKVFEDNEGALKLANGPLAKVTPQSKHFAVKYHWFREKLEEHNIEILPIRSEFQKADIFTKGLGVQQFRPKRKMINGW